MAGKGLGSDIYVVGGDRRVYVGGVRLRSADRADALSCAGAATECDRPPAPTAMA